MKLSNKDGSKMRFVNIATNRVTLTNIPSDLEPGEKFRPFRNPRLVPYYMMIGLKIENGN